MTWLYTSSVDKTCMKCHVSLFRPSDLKPIQRKLQSSYLCTFSWNFNLMLREKVMMIFLGSPVWNVIQESTKKPTSSYHISANMARKALKFRPELQRDVSSNEFFFSTSETSQKKSYSENSMMTCLEQRNPRIQSSDTKFYETSSRKDRKDRSTP